MDDDTPRETTTVVQRGEAWAHVAERVGVDVDDLVAANSGNATPLIVGQVLDLP